MYLADCRNNEKAMKACGPGNTCYGTLSSYRCVCNAKGFRNVENDPSRCQEGMLYVTPDL